MKTNTCRPERNSGTACCCWPCSFLNRGSGAGRPLCAGHAYRIGRQTAASHLVAAAECVPEEPPILFLSAAQARPGNRRVLASRPLLDALILVVPNWVCNISVKIAIICSYKMFYII